MTLRTFVIASTVGAFAAAATSSIALACAVPQAPARLIHLAKPNYPTLAMQVGAHGTFNVAVKLDARGHVTSASVPGKHPYAALDSDAIAAAKASTYAPAIKNCKPVASQLIVPVVFPPK